MSGTVEGYDDCLALVLPRKNVRVVVVIEVDQLSIPERRMIAAKFDPIARPVPDTFFLTRSSVRLKFVARIAGESAGKVAPVIGILFAFHCDLFAIIKLRYAAHAQRESEVQHRSVESRAVERHETHGVVVIRERRDL